MFDSAIQSYTATAPNSVTSGAVTARVNGAAVVPRGTESDAIELAVGENIFEVVVTAQDGVTMLTYTVTVTPVPALPLRGVLLLGLLLTLLGSVRMRIRERTSYRRGT